MDAPQNGLDEAIRLSDWNPGWPALAQAGMRAKAVLDLMIAAADTAQQEAFALQLSRAGWQDMGDAGVAGRRHLRRRGGKPANLHIVLAGSPHWANNLAIRDYLRAHPGERATYAAAKDAALAAGADQLLAYSEAKAAFMTALLQRATAWRQASEAQP